MKRRLFLIAAIALQALALQLRAGETVSLDGKWELKFWPQPVAGPIGDPADIKNVSTSTVSATVPGNVELDLQAAGSLKDLRIGNNVYAARAYEGYQWCYTRTFATPKLDKDQTLQLTFNGIDCLARVWLNGKLVGTPENMFIEHRYDITGLVNKAGPNTLCVIIRSPIIEAQKFRMESITGRDDEQAFIRKAPSQYGWDIVPRVLGAGLWRSVELNVLDPVRIDDVYWFTSEVDAAANTASLNMVAQYIMPADRYRKLTRETEISYKGKVVVRQKKLLDKHLDRQGYQMTDVHLWWPRGYGEAALYDATIRLVDEDGKVLAENKQHIGIRIIRLERSEINLPPDKPGKFCFYVNGEPIFVRGTNWVPLDGIHSRDEAQVKDALALVAEANCNMIRCWGGNVYEDHEFFDICDREGIMVWQDFALACAIYPNDPDFQKAMYEEAKAVVLKLRNHPSLVLWAGSNESDDTIFYIKTLNSFRCDPNKDLITRLVFPEVLYRYDLTRPYLPSSPYISPEVFTWWKPGTPANSMKSVMPDVHLWGDRAYFKTPFYNDCPAQFVSEVGVYGCPNVESLKKMMSPEGLYPWKNREKYIWNSEWIGKIVQDNINLEEKAGGRIANLSDRVIDMWGDCPDDLNEFVYASQMFQAEAMKYIVEVWRAAKFKQTGIIWWNIRDSWPIISPALVDYYNSKKPAFYFVANVQHDVCAMMLDAKDGWYPIVAVNDTRRAVKGATIEVVDVASGKSLYKGKFDVDPNGRTEVGRIPEQKGQGLYLIKYSVDGKNYFNHYLYGNIPFKLDDYRTWLKKANIYQNI